MRDWGRTPRIERLERLSTTFYGKRQSGFSLLFLESLNKSIIKIKNNSHAHNKRDSERQERHF